MRAKKLIASAAALAVGAGVLVGMTATAQELEVEPTADYLRWNVRNGSGNKWFQLFSEVTDSKGRSTPIGAREEYANSNPWIVGKDEQPDLIEVSARTNVPEECTSDVEGAEIGAAKPVHFGGRQRHGVQSPFSFDSRSRLKCDRPEKNSGPDTIDARKGEVLVIERGTDLAEFFFEDVTGLNLRAQSHTGTAVVTTKLGGTVVQQQSVPIVRGNNLPTLEFDAAFDTIEFSAADGGVYGIKTRSGEGAVRFQLSPARVISDDEPSVTDSNEGGDSVTTECFADEVVEEAGDVDEGPCNGEEIAIDQQILPPEEGEKGPRVSVIPTWLGKPDVITSETEVPILKTRIVNSFDLAEICEEGPCTLGDLPIPELNFPELGDGEADFSSPVLCATLDGGDPTPSIPACLLTADPGDLSQTDIVQVFEYKVYPVDPGWRFR